MVRSITYVYRGEDRPHLNLGCEKGEQVRIYIRSDQD